MLKIGDKVEYIGQLRSSAWANEGIVTHVKDDMCTAEFPDKSLIFDKIENFKLLMKFKVGDRVEYIGVLDAYRGLKAVITFINNSCHPYRVEFIAKGKLNLWARSKLFLNCKETSLQFIKKECTCDILVLMAKGCQCGSLVKYQEEWQ